MEQIKDKFYALLPELIKIIKIFDIFGQLVTLNINKERYYKTVFGGLSSVFIIFVLIIIFQSNILEFFRKEKVHFTTETLFSPNPGLVVMDSSNYMAAFSIEQDNFVQNPFFNISIEQRYYYRDDKGNFQKKSIKLELEPCTLKHFDVLLQDQNSNFTQEYDALKLNRWLCPRQDFTFNLSGTFTNQEFKFMRITVSACKESNQGYENWKPKCATDKERQDKLDEEGSFKLQIYQVNSVVNPDQSDQYYQSYLDGEMFFTFVPKKLSRQTNLYYRNYQFQNDESLSPIKDITQKDLIVRQSVDYRDLTELGSANDESYAIVYLRRSQFSEFITRRYMKIDELLSFLGGFLQIMIVGFGLLVIYYNRLSMQMELSNHLYNFPQGQNLEKSQIGLQSRQSLTNNNHLQKLVNSLIKYFERKKLIFNIKSLLHYLSDGYLFKDQQYSYFKLGIEKVDKDLDINEILHSIQHINKLKRTLLNEQQVILFNLSPKPTLGQEEDKPIPSRIALEQNDDTMKIERTKQEIAVDLYNAWIDVNKDSSKNPCIIEINTKLLQDLGTEIQEILQEFQNTQKDMYESIQKKSLIHLDVNIKQAQSIIRKSSK